MTGYSLTARAEAIERFIRHTGSAIDNIHSITIRPDNPFGYEAKIHTKQPLPGIDYDPTRILEQSYSATPYTAWNANVTIEDMPIVCTYYTGDHV